MKKTTLILALFIAACSNQPRWQETGTAESMQRCVDAQMHVVDPVLCQQLERDNVVYSAWPYHWYFGGSGTGVGSLVNGGYIARYPQRPSAYSPSVPYTAPAASAPSTYAPRPSTGSSYSSSGQSYSSSGSSRSSTTTTSTPTSSKPSVSTSRPSSSYSNSSRSYSSSGSSRSSSGRSYSSSRR